MLATDISGLFGTLSLCCWLFAQAPQILENYKRSSVESLALPFLVSWMLGDLTNLIGCVLTDQLVFQTRLAAYFVFVDCVIMSQFAYYSRYHPQPSLPPVITASTRSRSRSLSRRAMSASAIYSHNHHRDSSVPALTTSNMQDSILSTTSSQMASSFVGRAQRPHLYRHESPTEPSRISSQSRVRQSQSVILFSMFALLTFSQHLTPSNPTASARIWIARRGIFDDPPPTDLPPIDIKLLVGRVASWTCAILYLTSRLPQVWKNFRRKSVEGLSMLLFLAALSGNSTYVVSILSNPLIKSDPTFLPDSIPFLLGSGGTVVFDITIMLQAYFYRKSTRKLSDSVVYEVAGLLSPEEDIAENLDRRGRRGPSQESLQRFAPKPKREPSYPDPSAQYLHFGRGPSSSRGRDMASPHLAQVAEVPEGSPAQR